MVVFALMDPIGIAVNVSQDSLGSIAVSTSTNVVARHVCQALGRSVLMVSESTHVYAQKDGKAKDVKVNIRFS